MFVYYECILIDFIMWIYVTTKCLNVRKVRPPNVTFKVLDLKKCNENMYFKKCTILRSNSHDKGRVLYLLEDNCKCVLGKTEIS